MKKGKLIQNEDYLALEEPLEIVLKYKTSGRIELKALSVTMRTPGDDENLVLGFLYNENIIQSPQDILGIDFRFDCSTYNSEHQTVVLEMTDHIIPKIQNLSRHFYTNSSCGVCGKSSVDIACEYIAYVPRSLKNAIDQKILSKLPEQLRSAQHIFQLTGAIHACGLFDLSGNLIRFAEDVGRHNALDKLTGWALKNDLIPCSEHVIMLSGRASFELIQKSMSLGVPCVAAVGAPSHLAVELAKTNGMTLVGFLREDSMNIYSGIQRIHF